MQLYRPGSVVAERYEIKEVLGQGPVGATYLAFDKEMEADVVLKIVAAELLTSDTVREFEALLNKVQRFSHPNLRKIYEVDAQGSLALYTAAYHQGESLRQMLQGRKTFTHLEAEPILSQICQALTAAESITSHGALRPENILVLPDTVKVTDLGIAAALGSTYTATLRKGAASRYIAPELKAGGALTPRADVYSLGVIFYEMLAGEPYDGGAVSFSAKNAMLPPALDEVAKIALSQNPDDRYANTKEFSEDLASVIDTGKIKPRAASAATAAPSNPAAQAVSAPKTTTPSVPSLPAVSAASAPASLASAVPQETVITGKTQPQEAPLSVPDEAIELSVIAAPKVPEVSRIETIIPPAEVGDNDRTVVRATSSIPALKALNVDLETDSTGVRGAPQPPAPSRLADPGDDLFDSALREAQKAPKPPERKSPPVAPMPPITTSAAPAADVPARPPLHALSHDSSTALARPSDLPPPVNAPPSQGAVVMPSWLAGTLAIGLIAMLGVVIYLLVREPKISYIPNPPDQNPVAQTQKATDNPKPPDPKPVSTPASTPASIVASAPVSTSVPASTPASLLAVNTTNPANPNNPGATLPANPKNPTSAAVEPKNPTNPDPGNPKIPTPPVAVVTCPPGMAKLAINKKDYCIDKYEFPGKGAVPQTNVDYGTAEATCQAKGKRLCTSEEWGRACGGAYPYGKDFDPNACNTKDADDNPRTVAAAGSFPKCKAGGVFDMSGNVEEWVQGNKKRGGSAKSGDTFATCGKSSGGGASEFTGFRCCADPKEAPAK